MWQRSTSQVLSTNRNTKREHLGDLNCKIEVDGKFILAYATPLPEKEVESLPVMSGLVFFLQVNIIDANSFFSGEAADLLETNGTDTDKPTYIVYSRGIVGSR